MNNSVKDLEAIHLNELREINTTHRHDIEGLELKLFKAEHDNVTKDVLLGNAEFEIANLRDRLEGLDRMLNKTIDAHEVTKSRLALYENEVGIPHNKGIADHRLNG